LTIPVQRSTIDAVTTQPIGEQLVIVGDAHLGAVPASIEEAMLAFLNAVPDLGDCLLINGDLFDFWFAYRRVIPRHGFRIVSALAALRQRMPIAMTGGNHDRWGDNFWDHDLDIRFGPDGLRFRLGTGNVWALHGDGIAEQHWSARLMHRITRNRTALALFRQVPVDAAFRVVDRMSGHLADSTRDHAVLDRAATAQRTWAEARLRSEPDLNLVVMGHTHRPALSQPEPGQAYCNPGAWMDGLRYAVATDASVVLRQFS
jgi:UDP-2,3-diacylglucosamine hydrolase